MASYEGTNITGEKVVNHSRTQLNDALIESYPDLRFCQFYLGSGKKNLVKEFFLWYTLKLQNTLQGGYNGEKET